MRSKHLKTMPAAGKWEALCAQWAQVLGLPVMGRINRAAKRPLIVQRDRGKYLFILPEDSCNRDFLNSIFLDLMERYCEKDNLGEELPRLRRRMSFFLDKEEEAYSF